MSDYFHGLEFEKLNIIILQILFILIFFSESCAKIL